MADTVHLHTPTGRTYCGAPPPADRVNGWTAYRSEATCPDCVPNSGQGDWPEARTDNGVLIVPGLHVRDYNWRVTTVSDKPPHMSHGVAWFYTANGGMFDGSRLFAL